MTATFGTLATLLAVVGLYGVMSYTVSRRRREIGVRVVFGASAGNIRWLVIREVLVIAATGIALALPAAWWLARYVSTQLYGVEPTDPITFAGATVLLTVVAALAGLIPSSRQAGSDGRTPRRVGRYRSSSAASFTAFLAVILTRAFSLSCQSGASGRDVPGSHP
jgi:ABC-type lipoprotein release transport system permease subunit